MDNADTVRGVRCSYGDALHRASLVAEEHNPVDRTDCDGSSREYCQLKYVSSSSLSVRKLELGYVSVVEPLWYELGCALPVEGLRGRCQPGGGPAWDPWRVRPVRLR